MSTVPSQPQIAQRLLTNVTELPLWVKQVIYLQLRAELLGHFSEESLESLTLQDTIAFFIPKLTDAGERSLGEQDGPVRQFLLDVKNRFTILDICLKHRWTLEYCCERLMESIDSKWIQSPLSTKALGTFEFLANRIRLGQYLVKMGRISQEQLDQSLRTQQYIKEALQEHTGIANVLINLGYIKRQDIEGLLFLKEESQKPIENVTLFQSETDEPA